MNRKIDDFCCCVNIFPLSKDRTGKFPRGLESELVARAEEAGSHCSRQACCRGRGGGNACFQALRRSREVRLKVGDLCYCDSYCRLDLCKHVTMMFQACEAARALGKEETPAQAAWLWIKCSKAVSSCPLFAFGSMWASRQIRSPGWRRL